MFGFINRDTKHGLIYSGDASYLDYTIDDGEAALWYNSLEGKHINNVSFELDIYGKIQEYSLPLYKGGNTTYDILEDELKDYLSESAKRRLLPDKVLGIREIILKNYHVIGVDGTVCFLEKEDTIRGGKESRDNDEIGLSVIQREFLLGYARNQDYELVSSTGKTTMKLHKDIEVCGVTVPYNYTVGLRGAMFRETMESQGRETLLQKRQYEVLELMGHETYITAVRRSGKTFLASFVALREIMMNVYKMTGAFRPINVIYVGLTMSKNMKVVNYMRGMAKGFMRGNLNMFHRDGQRNILSFRSGKDVLGEITFVSQEMSDPGVGDYADLIIIDEAGKIKEDIFLGLLPIVQNEKAKLFCISTMYVDSLKGWFFERLVDSQKNSKEKNRETTKILWNNVGDINLNTVAGGRKYASLVDDALYELGAVGLRYTIDDVEHISDRDKERIKNDKSYRDNHLKYMTELYSRFPDEGRVIDYEGVLTRPEKVHGMYYDKIVVAYDPASDYDKPGLVALGRHSGVGKISLLHAGYITGGGTINEQIPAIVSLKNKMRDDYSADNGYIYFAMDGSQKPAVDLLTGSGVTVNLAVSYTSGTEVTRNKNRLNERRVPKKMLVDISRQIFENKNIYMPDDMLDLIKELDSFQRKQTPSGNIKYEAITGNDDITNAMMVGIYFLYEHHSLKHSLYSNVEGSVDIRKLIMDKRNEEALMNAEEKLKKAREEYSSISNLYFSKFGY